MDDAHHIAGPEHRLERLVFFSDAVFAIAITLLIIEIHPPHLRFADPLRAHLEALVEIGPEFMGFIISFFVIGAFWAGHHRAFALARHWNDRLIGANLLLLMAIVAMPFFTGYLSANPGARLPVVLYTVWMLVAALLNIRLQRLVTAPPILAEDADPRLAANVRIRGRSVALGAVIAIIGAAILPLPGLGLIALCTIPMWRKFLEKRNRAAE